MGAGELLEAEAAFQGSSSCLQGAQVGRGQRLLWQQPLSVVGWRPPPPLPGAAAGAASCLSPALAAVEQLPQSPPPSSLCPWEARTPCRQGLLLPLYQRQSVQGELALNWLPLQTGSCPAPQAVASYAGCWPHPCRL